jgi:hypothetical protein
MYDRYELPVLVDMDIQSAYRAVLFQMVFWYRCAKEAAVLRTLRSAGIGDEDGAYKHYKNAVDMIFGPTDKESMDLDANKAAKIMEEESKKAWVVSPIQPMGLRLGRKKK